MKVADSHCSRSTGLPSHAVIVCFRRATIPTKHAVFAVFPSRTCPEAPAILGITWSLVIIGRFPGTLPPTNRLRHWVFVILVCCLLATGSSACVSLPFYIAHNSPLSADQLRKTQLKGPEIDPTKLPNGVFVGLALSGGGSRAANFSAAVLFELEELGILRYVAAISSVSGSSLTAAYYRLNSDNQSHWNPENAQKLLRTDFEARWLWSWLLPQNFLRAATSYYDRSEHMASVFDSVLFHGKRFRDLPQHGPLLLIDASTLGQSIYQFPFDRVHFHMLGSDLETYSISHAVMASAAFPGAFRNVTLRRYDPDEPSAKRYIHLMDGGITDNLGVSALYTVLVTSAPEWKAQKLNGCFLIIADAYASAEEQSLGSAYGRQRRVGSTGIGMLIDHNAMIASDLLLRSQRVATLARLGYKDMYKDRDPLETLFNDTDMDIPRDRPLATLTIGDFLGVGGDSPLGQTPCQVWTLNFDRLHALAGYRHFARIISEPRPKLDEERIEGLYKVATSIKTRFRLIGPAGMNQESLQRALYEAAHVLVRDDPTVLPQVCDWFKKRGLALKEECAPPLVGGR